jgi:hypothetical protein
MSNEASFVGDNVRMKVVYVDTKIKHREVIKIIKSLANVIVIFVRICRVGFWYLYSWRCGDGKIMGYVRHIECSFEINHF